MTRKKEGRRGNGEGSCQKIRTLTNGESVYEWAIRVTLPSGEGKRLKGRAQCRSIEDARKTMWAAKVDAEAGQQLREKELLVADLLDEWMEVRRTSGVSPRTLDINAELIRLHIRPRMGKWKVSALTPGLVEDFHRDLLTQTSLGQTRQKIHVVLRLAMGATPFAGVTSTATPRGRSRCRNGQSGAARPGSRPGPLRRPVGCFRRRWLSGPRTGTPSRWA